MRRRGLPGAFALLVLWLLALAWAPMAAAQPVPAAPAVAAPPPAALALSAGEPVIPLAGHSRYWMDESAALTVDQVDAAGETLPWRVRQAGQQHHIDRKALWLQFDARSTDASRWFLQIASSGIDRVQMFHRDAAGRWVTLEAGDTRPVSQWPLPGRVPTFELASDPNRTVRYYLRVEHERVDFAVPVALYPQGRLFAEREREQFLLGAYFGLAALIALVAIANAAVHRDRAFGVYAVYVVVLALGQAAYLGVGAQHLWDRHLDWNAMSTFLLPGVSSAAGLWFVRTVTEPARFSRALDLMVWSLLAAQLSAVALDSFLTSRATFSLVLALTLAAVLMIAALIAAVWLRGEEREIRLVALGFLPVVIMALFPLARGLNLIPNSALTRYGVTIGAMLEMPILFYALALRGSRRRESAVRAAALAHTDALTGLAHGRTLLQALDAALARARSLKHPCALLAINIANREALVAEFGPDAMDKALVVTASNLRRAVADIDVPARVGEALFAVLLDGPTNAGVALSRAQHIIASGLRQAEGLPRGLTLKYHVAVAMLPEGEMDAAGTLAWALDGVRGIPPDARKMIRPMNF